MKAIRKFTVRTVLPERLGALDEPSQATCAGRGTSRPGACSSAIDPDGLARDRPRPDRPARRGRAASASTSSPPTTASSRGPNAAARRPARLPRASRAGTSRSTDAEAATIAYFSPEFGIAAALPQYSGGLGILAGDHLKSASDLGVPLIGVGLFYRAGYFRQAISRDGWQQESYPVLDPDGLPLAVLRQPDGTAAQVALALPDGRALLRPRLAGAGRPRAAAAARHRHPRERRRPARRHRPALRRRRRAPPAAGAAARHRRRARAQALDAS